MNFLSPSADRYREPPLKVMEKDMKTLTHIKSTSKWIAALTFGFCLSLGSATQAMAQQNNAQNNPWLSNQAQKNNQNAGDFQVGGNGPDPEPPHVIKHSYTKSAQQLRCKFVRFRIKLSVEATDGFWEHPDLPKFILASKLDLFDKLPKGLSWVNASMQGDVGQLGVLSYSTTNHPNDTVKVTGFKLSKEDKDGQGGANTRSIITILTAKIDPAEFPNPKVKSNQAKLTIHTFIGNLVAKSHNPALPDPADWFEGTPTKFEVDLTDCDKPEDGGGDPHGEPCIKFEKGEVQCKGDAIAPFKYKMPVSPALAGTTIELTSLTPGVVVNPAFQVVPPGGGILEWDLIGAAKGMTIHLLTNNVKQVGPADFDGIATCCTEEIIIEIPEDIPCDEEEKEPDLEVKKRALMEECDKATGPCNFRIRVKNVGDKKYTGKLALREWQIPHRAAITNGPNLNWNCTYNNALGLYDCTHPALTLNPGEFKDLKLGFTPGNAWPSDKIKNCAKLNYNKMGVAPFGDLTNDKDCAEICIKGSNDCPDEEVEKKPELEIKKFSTGTQCIGGIQGVATCWVNFSVIIHNTGDAAYNGPLHVEDKFNAEKPDLVTFNPMPPWNCATVDGIKFDCTHPGINLPANGQTILTVKAKYLDPSKVDEKTVENCVKLEEGAEGKDQDCAKGELPGEPEDDGPVPGDKTDLSIDKSCQPGVLGSLISCRITVRNNGDRAPRGIIRIYDVARVLGTEAPLTSENVTPDGPEWSCAGDPAPDLVCAIDGQHLTPGITRFFDTKIRLSGNTNERFRNCATGHHEPNNSEDGRTIIGKSCVEGGVDIRVEKTGDAICQKGEDCTFDLTFKNNGETDFSGNVKFVDALGLAAAGMNVPITSISPPLPCAVQPASLPFNCEGNLNLAAGESQSHKVTVVFPENSELTKEDALRNCAAIVDPGLFPGKTKSLEKADNGANGGNAIVGCHEFNLDDEREPQCKPPLVMNNKGVCVCPAGTEWNGRRCVGDDGPPTFIPPVGDDPRCIPGRGEIRTSDNRCICIPGFIRRGPDRCVPPKEGCKPRANEYKNRAGRCVCKPGFDRNNSGICVKPPRGCKPGRNEIKDQNGRCVCKPGFSRTKRGNCVRIPTQCKLAPNEFRNSQGQCVCKNGYTRNNKGFCSKQPTVVPACRGGKLIKRGKGLYCACPKGWNRKPIGKKGGAICTKPPASTPTPVCKGGKLTKRGKGWYCGCPKGTTRKGLKNGGAICTRKPVSTPKPVCKGGKLTKRGKGWFCGCPKGTTRKGLKNGGAICARKPVSRPKPVCSNGRLLKRGKGWYCACPKGWKRNGLKNGGARCIKKAKVFKPKKPVFKPKVKVFKPKPKKVIRPKNIKPKTFKPSKSFIKKKN